MAITEEPVAARIVGSGIPAHIPLVSTGLRDLNQIAIIAYILSRVVARVAAAKCRLVASEHWAQEVAVPAHVLPRVVLGVPTSEEVIWHALVDRGELIVGAGVLRCKVACVTATKCWHAVGDWTEEIAIVAVVL